MAFDVCAPLLGLRKLHRDLCEFSEFARSLDDTVATIELTPDDNASLQAAIRTVERIVDRKFRRTQRNADASSVLMDLKETRIANLHRRFRDISKHQRGGANPDCL